LALNISLRALFSKARNLFFPQNETEEVSSSGDSSDYYSRGAQFEFRPGHLTMMTKVFHEFLQSVQTNAEMVPYIRPFPIPSTLFPIHFSISFVLVSLYTG
jgi:hypothetical protein